MRFVTPLAALSAVGLSHARLGGLEPRMPGNECCPCAGTGEPGLDRVTVTLTVTQPGPPAKTIYVSDDPKETVTVSRTVTRPATTVYVTKGGEAGVVTQEVPGEVAGDPETMAPEESVKTHNLKIQPTDQQAVTIKPPQDSQPTPKVVTVTKVHKSPSPIAISEVPGEQRVTTTLSREPGQQEPTSGPEDSASASEEPTFEPGKLATERVPEPQDPETVGISVEPSIQTVTRQDDDTAATATIQSPLSNIVTAAPETVSVVHTAHHYETITHTVTNGNGNIDIQIIIINIDTGETTCIEENNGLPCDDGSSMPPKSVTTATVSCPPVEATTSVATLFNTVTLTVGQKDVDHNGTVSMWHAMPTSGLRGRTPRGPPPSARRWW
jgi:hypothetical protein